MYTHPYLATEMARYRQQEILTQAGRHHLAAERRAPAREPGRTAASRPTFTRRVLGAATQLRLAFRP
jgi:hypothetical protein